MASNAELTDRVAELERAVAELRTLVETAVTQPNVDAGAEGKAAPASAPTRKRGSNR